MMPADEPWTRLDRRRFLKGLGVAVTLPALESLSPGITGMARAASTDSGAPLRMAFMSIPNGVQQDHWFPSGESRKFKLNRSMSPLDDLKNDIQVIGGLNHENATPGNDGGGGHARGSATYLTGARARKTAGRDIQVGVSVDQYAAQRLGHLTRFPSLELSCDAIRNTGSCDSGYSCAYQYNISWSSPSTPVTPEPNPRLAFERLFGAGSPGERNRNYQLRQQSQRSVLDFVLEEASSVQRQLGHHDRHKLEEYFAGVRAIEKRIRAADGFGAVPDPAVATPVGIPDDFSDHMQIMYDILVLAFQSDATRVATLLLAHDGSNRTFPQIGIAEGHHYLTHNQHNAEYVKKIADIDRFYLARFANFLKKLAKTEDVDGNSLLHNSIIVYGGGISDGNSHAHDNLPCILAGAGGGRTQPGRYLPLEKQPMSNLFVTMLNHMGIPVEDFGDSTRRLEEV